MAGALNGGWHHQTIGSGSSAIIWLHGWGQSHDSFMPLAGLYAHSHTSLIYDLPGFGQTPRLEPKAGKAAGTADYADALAAEMAREGITSATIIGHSFGCRLAVQLAHRHADLVERLVLISGAGIPRKRSPWWKVRSKMIKQLGKLASAYDSVLGTDFRSRWSTKYGSADYRNAGELQPTFVSVVNENLTTQATEIKQPALLIYGENDAETPPEIGTYYHAAFPTSELHILDGYDHFDILGRGKHQCQRLIDRFVGGN